MEGFTFDSQLDLNIGYYTIRLEGDKKNLHKYSFGACVKGSCQVALQVRM